MDERQSLSSDRQPPLKSLAGVLQAVVQRIKIEHYLLAIAVTILVVILVLGAIWIAPEFSGPVYAALIVIGVLALAALIVTAVLATKRQQGTKDKIRRLEKQVSPPPTPIPFQNREDELKYILSSFAPAYFLLDAPARYGKSVLLQQLAERFRENNWVVAHVCLDEHCDTRQLVGALAQELGVQCPTLAPDRSRWGEQLVNTIAAMFKAATYNGLVFLIDLDKKPAPGILEDILDRLIPGMQKSLNSLAFFPRGHNPFRVILAGRYLARQPETTSCAIRPRVLQLTPFDHNVVMETVRTYLPQYMDDVIIEAAAHLMHLTGGHPGCLAHCLEKCKNSRLHPNTFLTDCSTTVWTEIVRPVVQDVRDSAGELRAILDRLSVFRRLDYALLRQLIGQRIIVWHGDEYQLADRLTGTYLLSWQEHWLQDDITRRLLTIRLREEEEENLQEWCRQAQNVCMNRLQQSGTQSPWRWAIEYLYQVLQEHASAIQDAQQRQALRRRFFAEEVARALRLLTDGQEPREIIEPLMRVLVEDWEFRFTVNYFLREDVYSDKPYQKLHKQVQAWLSP